MQPKIRIPKPRKPTKGRFKAVRKMDIRKYYCCYFDGQFIVADLSLKESPGLNEVELCVDSLSFDEVLTVVATMQDLKKTGEVSLEWSNSDGDDFNDGFYFVEHVREKSEAEIQAETLANSERGKRHEEAILQWEKDMKVWETQVQEQKIEEAKKFLESLQSDLKVKPKPTDLRMLVVVQPWSEFERGWGCRPDGYSLHLTEEDRVSFIKGYTANRTGAAPYEYDAPDGSPYWAYVKVGEIPAAAVGGVRCYGKRPLPKDHS